MSYVDLTVFKMAAILKRLLGLRGPMCNFVAIGQTVAADKLRDLVTLPFDFGRWSYMLGHVRKPSTKSEDPTVQTHPFLSYEVCHSP